MTEKTQTTGPFQGHQKNQKREIITCVAFNKDILRFLHTYIHSKHKHLRTLHYIESIKIKKKIMKKKYLCCKEKNTASFNR